MLCVAAWVWFCLSTEFIVKVNPACIHLWLYLDAEVLVLPPVFLPQDAVFVGRRSSSPANVASWEYPSLSLLSDTVPLPLSTLGIPLPLSTTWHLGNTPPFLYCLIQFPSPSQLWEYPSLSLLRGILGIPLPLSTV